VKLKRVITINSVESKLLRGAGKKEKKVAVKNWSVILQHPEAQYTDAAKKGSVGERGIASRWETGKDLLSRKPLGGGGEVGEGVSNFTMTDGRPRKSRGASKHPWWKKLSKKAIKTQLLGQVV